MQQLQVTELAAFVGRETGTLLLDVREPWEVDLARISLPGAQALAVPMQQIPARIEEIGRAQPVVCICHHGARSAQVVAFLARHGIERVYNLAGGVDAWSVQVDPTVPRY